MLRTLSLLLALSGSLLLHAQSGLAWTTFGGGTDQQVEKLLVLSNGDLLVTGQFTTAGRAMHYRVARWDGTTFHPMPGFPERFEITSLAELNDTIYVGGRPQGPWSDNFDLMKWDGTSWTSETVFIGMIPGVDALYVHDGMLYAAGWTYNISGNSSTVLRLNGTAWEWAGQRLQGAITCLGAFNGQLVCGGSFTRGFESTGPDIRRIAYLDNDTWTQLGDGLDGTPRALLVHQDALYATGNMRSPTQAYFGLARLTEEATTWEPLMPNVEDYIRAPFEGVVYGHSLVGRNGVLYIGGEFVVHSADQAGRGLAVFHGAPDAVEPGCRFGGPVQSVALINEHELVIGGRSTAYRNIASTNLLTARSSELAAQPSFLLAPNPTSGNATIRMPAHTVEQLRVWDLNGRLLHALRPQQGIDVPIDLSAEPAGSYIIEIHTAGQVHRQRLVVIR